MWRQNTFPGDPDSDQSISDGEDFDADLRDNCVSSKESTEKEEGLQIQSRLDILKGSYESRTSTSFSPKRQTSISLGEDEVEIPDFADKGGFIFSSIKASACDLDEEAISDDEENKGLKVSVQPGVKTIHTDGVDSFGSERQDVANSWVAASKEAEALICSDENAFCPPSHFSYSKANKSCKGIKSKSKTKFSFRFQSHKRPSWPFVYKDEHGVPSKFQEVPERFETIDCGEHSISEPLEDYHGEKPKQSEAVPDEVEDFHRYGNHSAAELLDGLQDSTSLQRRSSKMYSRTRRKRVQVVLKRSTSTIEDGTIDSEDLPEPVGSRSSSDDEVNGQNLKILLPEIKKQTIADRFQEALGANSSDQAALVVPKRSGFGLFGKLQQVMQSEKVTDTDFLNLQTRASPNSEPSCIDVKILSRYFEAKLIVCRVCSGKDIEGLPWPEGNRTKLNGRREKTIIFNPRVCCDVDLEVGNSIRVHSPWKEVRVRENDESIILSTYFSQISP